MRIITKEETREAILAAATGLFLRYGPVKTSMADIARELSMSPPNLYNFYPCRDAILEAIGTRDLLKLQGEITAAIAQTPGDWERIAVMFISTARHMHDKLGNEKDILQLQAIEKTNRWKFVEDFNAFLRRTAEAVLLEAISAGRLAHDDPSGAIAALFDCMITAWDPVFIQKFQQDEHLRRVAGQLSLLEKAFRKTSTNAAPVQQRSRQSSSRAAKSC